MFPEQKILGYQDFLQYGSKILEEDFDFLIMPGWSVNDLLRGKLVDAFINVRSMMEMNRSVIQNYFRVIQTSLKENGVFACINRYMKKVINQSNTVEINGFADYPFDAYWSPLYSFPSATQPHIHLMIAKRESKKPLYLFIEILKTLKQNAYLGN
jgi:membrane-bound lytic murein transglycosylase